MRTTNLLFFVAAPLLLDCADSSSTGRNSGGDAQAASAESPSDDAGVAGRGTAADAGTAPNGDGGGSGHADASGGNGGDAAGSSTGGAGGADEVVDGGTLADGGGLGGTGGDGGSGGGSGGVAGDASGGSGSPLMHLVSVTLDGSGQGTVQSEPAGIDCGAACTAEFVANIAVVLTAEPAEGSRFVEWQGDCQGAQCVLDIDGARSVTAVFRSIPTGPPNIAFVTSTVQAGNLGGLAGGDSICAERAQAASLDGNYVAWLSSSSIDAVDRLGSASGWVRTDGKPFANDPRGPIYYPLRLDEFGNDLWTASALTGTTAAGTARVDGTCGDWLLDTGSAAAGAIHTTTTSWTDYYGGDNCAFPTHIYCFGVDSEAEVTPTSASDRLAFLSEAPFTPGGGIESADALCAGEASEHGLAGTYRALLATATASPASRFSSIGESWVRPDGVEIVSTAADLFDDMDGAILDAPINLTLSGNYYSAYEFVWTGIGAATDGRTMQTPGVAETTCDSWQTNSSLVEGQSGYAGDTNLPLGVNGNVVRSCDGAFRIYCLRAD